MFIFISLFFRATSSVLQMGAMWLVIYWVNGNLPIVLVEIINLDQESLIFPVVGSLFLILSAVLSLLSKLFGITAVKKFEKKISNDDIKINSSDYRNVAKLLLSVIDVIVPAVLLTTVVILWSLEYAWLIILAVLLGFLGIWILKKGVSYVSPFYVIKPHNNKSGYLHSAERIRFYKILMVPQYISMAVFLAISIILVAVAIASKSYVDISSGFHSLLVIMTIVSLLQLRSFVGLMVKMGAYKGNVANMNKLRLLQSQEG